MPHDPRRIEAAARAILREHVADNGDADAIWSENLARVALDAAFPELSSDPPSAWLAPWEATEAMQAAMGKVTPTHGGHYDNYRERDRLEQAPRWQAARDAHTKEHFERVTLEMHEAAAKAVRSRPRSRRPHQGADMSEWQDIETAPKDGTRVLLVRADNPEMHTAFWRDGKWLCGGMGYVNGPSYWMPLPPPPKDAKT